MRDGIWKGSPLPREWELVLKSCSRASERGQIVQSKLSHALAKALAGLSSGFLRRLRQHAAAADLCLPGLSDPALLDATTELELVVAVSFSRFENGGSHGPDLLPHAIEAGLSEWCTRMERQFRQHCLDVAGNDASSLIKAFHAARDATDFAGIVTDYLQGNRPGRSAPRIAIDLDEDLARPL